MPESAVGIHIGPGSGGKGGIITLSSPYEGPMGYRQRYVSTNSVVVGLVHNANLVVNVSWSRCRQPLQFRYGTVAEDIADFVLTREP